MYYTIDLRFLILPIVNIFSQFLLSSQQSESSSSSSSSAAAADPSINYTVDLPILGIILLFLLVSVQLPLSLSVATKPVRLRFADFYLSLLLAFTLFASIFLPPALFCYCFVICFCLFLLAPSSRSLLHRFKRKLQATPTYVITSIELSEVAGRQRRTDHEEIHLKELIYGHA